MKRGRDQQTRSPFKRPRASPRKTPSARSPPWIRRIAVFDRECIAMLLRQPLPLSPWRLAKAPHLPHQSIQLGRESMPSFMCTEDSVVDCYLTKPLSMTHPSPSLGSRCSLPDSRSLNFQLLDSFHEESNGEVRWKTDLSWQAWCRGRRLFLADGTWQGSHPGARPSPQVLDSDWSTQDLRQSSSGTNPAAPRPGSPVPRRL